MREEIRKTAEKPTPRRRCSTSSTHTTLQRREETEGGGADRHRRQQMEIRLNCVSAESVSSREMIKIKHRTIRTYRTEATDCQSIVRLFNVSICVTF